ncbi:acyl-CoA dehydrogenase family protein [Acidisphaera rubrifaciens]|uniref:Acyl-CoA dehydrogenase n=1 Tax=Acidisphaera rubrifaciens HS-AP3 TaxID=1231350 RepID=A0A0D6PB84_9PROT|nr:acyl-CoA dehydrogenase family protein [Acidisphaera rubrifaciens]GAN78468.1 acyl-CoA dehydrogenase [Acidisphaera rubrifaciens HS-AP3]
MSGTALSNAFTFAPPPPSPAAEALRAEVRAFLRDALADRKPLARAESWSGFDADFSRAMGRRGWIGMTWPKQYGGHERSALERYVVLEEMLAAGAPVSAHWIADRQSGPLLLRLGTEAQRRDILPRIAAGECYFCIGMSEPDSGSDLASVRTRAVRVDGGYVVNGTKLWTSNAHQAHYMILLCRTPSADGGDRDDRHGGVSQLLVDLKTPGISIRPVHALTGEHHFNEVVFTDCFLPAEALIGTEGDGWAQVTSELALERSGPERFLSSFTLLVELVRALGPSPDGAAAVAVGRLAAHIMTLRRLSRSVAGMLQAGANPALQASLVKDLGALVEQEIPEIARLLLAREPDAGAADAYAAVLAYTMQHAPSFSLRGGTREILRGIIARGLGLR